MQIALFRDAERICGGVTQALLCPPSSRIALHVRCRRQQLQAYHLLAVEVHVLLLLMLLPAWRSVSTKRQGSDARKRSSVAGSASSTAQICGQPKPKHAQAVVAQVQALLVRHRAESGTEEVCPAGRPCGTMAGAALSSREGRQLSGCWAKSCQALGRQTAPPMPSRVVYRVQSALFRAWACSGASRLQLKSASGSAHAAKSGLERCGLERRRVAAAFPRSPMPSRVG